MQQMPLPASHPVGLRSFLELDVYFYLWIDNAAASSFYQGQHASSHMQ